MFLAWIDTAYGDFPTVESRLRELGVRYIRDGLCPTCSYNVNRLNQLSADGHQGEHHRRHAGGWRRADERDAERDPGQVRGAVVSIEAPNEPNLTGDPHWIQHAREYQQRLYTRQGRPGTCAPAGALASGRLASRTQLGDLTA